MNFLFAWRYFKSKKSTNAINIIAWISVVAITVGTAALIVVLSVFNGFEDLVKGLYGDFYADAKIAPAKGKLLTIDSTQLAKIKNVNGVIQYSLVAEEKALLKNAENQTTVIAKGVDEYFNSVNKVSQHIIRGNFETGTLNAPQIVMGAGIENATAIYIEQNLEAATLYLPNKKATSLNNLNDAFNSYNVTASGTFLIQQEFDNKYIFTNLPFMKFMLDMAPNQYSYIELKLQAKNDAAAEKITTQLQQMLGNNYVVLTRYQQNKSLYSIMRMEKWIIYGILSLILVVAAFNMIGALTMLVLEKQKDIAILQAMGASNQKIQHIFLSSGLILAAVGSFCGLAIASLICWLQVKFHLLKLGAGSFVVDYYPVKLQVNDFVLVITTIFIIAFIAAYFPARKAGKQAFSLKS
ncbi:MAG: FtsX-like permease family protein [Chitinophagaceae bacterium]|nr:ABC transporter permease [Chitinophagaceae bacterium]